MVTIRYNFVDVLVNLSAEIIPSNKADVKTVLMTLCCFLSVLCGRLNISRLECVLQTRQSDANQQLRYVFPVIVPGQVGCRSCIVEHPSVDLEGQ